LDQLILGLKARPEQRSFFEACQNHGIIQIVFEWRLKGERSIPKTTNSLAEN
jgi:hypothetical protein